MKIALWGTDAGQVAAAVKIPAAIDGGFATIAGKFAAVVRGFAAVAGRFAATAAELLSKTISKPYLG